jgi:hypothetical protein
MFMQQAAINHFADVPDMSMMRVAIVLHEHHRI